LLSRNTKENIKKRAIDDANNIEERDTLYYEEKNIINESEEV